MKTPACQPAADWPVEIARGPELPAVMVRPVQLLAAAELVTQILADGQPADRALQRYFRQHHRLGKRDRQLTQELVYFSLRHWRLLDWLLDAEPANPAQRIAAALWLGDRLDAVLAERAGLPDSRLATLADRRARDWQGIPPAIRYSLDDQDGARLEQAVGDTAETLMTAMNRPAGTDIRINPQRATTAAVRSELDAAGIRADPVPGLPQALRITGHVALTRLPRFRDGGFEIQDAGSQWIAAACTTAPGERLLDLCAGGGGKTLALAGTSHDQAQILACDVAADRLERLQPRLARAGLKNVTALPIRGSADPALQDHAPFDCVLVDAPCSGSGTWRRHPELKQAGIPLDPLRATQAQLLRDAAALVRPGGRLVYATCSLWREENEDPVEHFLAEQPDWRIEAAPAPPGASDAEQRVRLRPDRDGTDGFFYVRLRAPG